MATDLTPKQKGVLSFLREFVARHGFAPTAKEVGDRFGIAEKNGFYYLDLLERKGYIRRKRFTPRRIEFSGTGVPEPPVRVPVLGRVPAGRPSEAIEDHDDGIFLDASLAGSGEVFSLRVTGDSMTGDAIREGDFLLVRYQQDAADGEIVVATVDGEATVKRLRKKNGSFVLEASNPAYPPIVVPAESPSFRIAGKVVGVYRKI